MELNFVPELCKGEEANFEGEVVISLPSSPQKWKYAKEAGLKVKPGGEIEMMSDPIDVMIKMSEHIKTHIKELKLQRKDDGQAIDMERLFFDPECEGILIELCSALMHGFKPSKN